MPRRITDLEGTTYDYDDNGNLTDRGSDTFAWDHENRMTESVVGGVTTTYEYNGAGIRTSRTVAGNTIDYVWDTAGALPVVLDDGTYRYVYGLDLIPAIEADDTEHYRLYDGLGSVTEVTDSGGSTEASYRYDVFGAVRSSSGSSALEWLFTGEQYDGLDAVMVEDLALGGVSASTNLTGATTGNLDDDPDDPDANWATASSTGDTAITVAFPTPTRDPETGSGVQEDRSVRAAA